MIKYIITGKLLHTIKLETGTFQNCALYMNILDISNILFHLFQRQTYLLSCKLLWTCPIPFRLAIMRPSPTTTKLMQGNRPMEDQIFPGGIEYFFLCKYRWYNYTFITWWWGRYEDLFPQVKSYFLMGNTRGKYPFSGGNKSSFTKYSRNKLFIIPNEIRLYNIYRVFIVFQL